MNQYVLSRFATSYKATIGVDFLSKDVMLEDRMVTLQVRRNSGRFSPQPVQISVSNSQISLPALNGASMKDLGTFTCY